MDVHSLRSTCGCLLTLLLAACGAGRPANDVAFPDAERASLVGSRSERDDETLMGAPQIERAAFVGAVLRRNPSIEAARQAWRGARARGRQAGTVDDPMINLELAPLSVGSSSAPLGYTAMASQRLPWPGKLGLEETIANAEADAAKSDFEGTRRDLALAAATLYDDYFIAVRSIEVTAQHVALMRDLQAAALAQFESGRASAQDALQAEAELAHMEHDAVVLVADRDVAVAQMNALLHRDPERPFPLPTKEIAIRDVPTGSAKNRLKDEESARRPEIEAARSHARAEGARAQRAEREAFPDITVSTSYNSMWDMPEHRWMVGVGLNLPLHVGRRAAVVDEARASRARFESDVLSMTDKARAEVTVSKKRLEEAEHVIRLLETRLVPVAREQIDAARAGFVTSRNDFVAVVGAERNLRSAELDLQRARANFDKRSAELERALGRIPGLDDDQERAR